MAGDAALRTRAVSILRRVHEHTCLERTEILSRGRAQAVTALALPAAHERLRTHRVTPGHCATDWCTGYPRSEAPVNRLEHSQVTLPEGRLR